MYQRDFVNPQRIREGFSCCPPVVTSYMTTHMDSLPKIVTHLLLLALVCDVMLFLTSFQVSVLPIVGFPTLIIALMMLVQTVVVLLIWNNRRMSSFQMLQPNEFMVGVALGISIAASVLAFVLHHMYGRTCERNDRYHPAKYNRTETDDATAYSENGYHGNDPVSQYLCEKSAGAINAVWFWSGILVWLQACLAMLIYVGRHEVSGAAANTQYEAVGTTDSNFTAPPPAFVGNYGNVPDISNDLRNNSEYRPSGYNARTDQAYISQV